MLARATLDHFRKKRAAMPRYYFHVHDGDGSDQDYVGTELASIHEARREAVNVARELCDLWADMPPRTASFA
jgi:hypothetical protein